MGFMSGRALFSFDPTLFKDDEAAAIEENYEEDSDDDDEEVKE